MANLASVGNRAPTNGGVMSETRLFVSAKRTTASATGAMREPGL